MYIGGKRVNNKMKMTKNAIHKEVDFDHWSAIADSDPEQFEQMRQAVIDEVIARAPERQQQRLRCLQWRIDQERRLAGTPLAACIRISDMMWDQVTGPSGLLQALHRLKALMTEDQEPACVPAHKARILRFESREK